MNKEIFDLKLKGDAKWAYFMKFCNSERTQPTKSALELWYCLSREYKIFISTARNENCKEATLHKLAENCFFTTEDNLFPSLKYSTTTSFLSVFLYSAIS